MHCSSSLINELRIAVSYYCNLRCQHCYVPELNRTKYKSLLESSQLSIDQINEFVAGLRKNHGLGKISVTGGEAMLHVVWPRTSSVVQAALSEGLEVRLNTSGSGQVGPSALSSLVGAQERLLLQVSLDGVDEASVDAFRGRSGAMARAWETIQEAVTHGLRVQIRYTGTNSNIDQAQSCYRIVSEMGVESFVIKPMFSAGTARENADLMIETREMIRELQQALLRDSVGNSTELKLPQPAYVSESDFPLRANASIMHCQCGGKVAYLSTNGDIYPCTYLVGDPSSERYVLGNIKDPQFDFVEAWKKPEAYNEFRSAEKDANCTAQNILERSSQLLVASVPAAEAQCGAG